VLSFIVPAHNEEFELPSTLASIRDAARQHEHEIIVVDDASADRTPEIAKDFGAKVIAIDRRQIAAARNAGARAAKGDVLFFVDADTRINSKHVEGAIGALNSGFSGGSARVEVDRAIPFWANFWLQVFCFLYFRLNLGAGAFLFTTRRNYDAVGGLDERYFAAEEVIFSHALKKYGRFKILSEPMITSGRKMRMHSVWHIWKRLTRMMLGGLRSYRSRDALDLWYDGKRETNT
jgi:glycosyltransferase involved in cell wall biosynthesis